MKHVLKLLFNYTRIFISSGDGPPSIRCNSLTLQTNVRNNKQKNRLRFFWNSLFPSSSHNFGRLSLPIRNCMRLKIEYGRFGQINASATNKSRRFEEWKVVRKKEWEIFVWKEEWKKLETFWGDILSLNFPIRSSRTWNSCKMNDGLVENTQKS